MISRDVGSAQGVVDGQGKVDNWPSVRPGGAQRRNHDPRDGPQVPDGWIVDDRRDVVEHKGTGEAIVIGGQRRENHEQEACRRGEGRLANRNLSIGHQRTAGMGLVQRHFRCCGSKHVRLRKGSASSISIACSMTWTTRREMSPDYCFCAGSAPSAFATVSANDSMV